MQNQDWDQRYKTQNTPWESGQPQQEMQRLFMTYIPAGKTVLEIGCGLGTNALWLANAGFKVTAIDLSATALQYAKEKADHAGLSIHFQVMDFLKEWQLLPRFQVIFDCAVFHVFDEQQRHEFAAHVANLCHQHGYWINISCSKDQADTIMKTTGVNPPPVLSAQDIISAVEPHFEIMEMHRCSFTIDRGTQGKADFSAWGSVFRKR